MSVDQEVARPQIAVLEAQRDAMGGQGRTAAAQVGGAARKRSASVRRQAVGRAGAQRGVVRGQRLDRRRELVQAALRAAQRAQLVGARHARDLQAPVHGGGALPGRARRRCPPGDGRRSGVHQQPAPFSVGGEQARHRRGEVARQVLGHRPLVSNRGHRLEEQVAAAGAHVQHAR